MDIINRSETLTLIETHLKSKNLIKHCLASEAVMRALAKHFGEDEEVWGLAGLLHDADVELTVQTPEKQGSLIGEMLGDKITKEMRYAMSAHNPYTGIEPKSRFDLALSCGETITGLIVAGALILPDKKLASLTPESIVKRFHEKRFAAGANRELIMRCEKIGFTLEQFAAMALKAMQGIADELGL